MASKGRGRVSLSIFRPERVFTEKWPEILPWFLSTQERVCGVGNNGSLHTRISNIMACLLPSSLSVFFNTI